MSDGEGSSSASSLQLTISVMPILVPMGVHFILVCFVLLGNWLPVAYWFSHLGVFLSGLWAVQDQKSILAVVVFLVVVVMTVLLDIIELGVFFGPNENSNGGGNTTSQRLWQFSAGMCIINLILKPLTIVLAVLTIYIRTKGEEAAMALFRSRRGYTAPDGQQQ